MAVRAQQDAFRNFGPHVVNRSGDTPHGHAKALGHRIAVVELESAKAFVISAKNTPTSSFVNQELLDLAPTPLDRLRPASLAPQPLFRTHDCEASASMSPAVAHQFSRTVLHRIQDPLPPNVNGPGQVVASDPAPNGLV